MIDLILEYLIAIGAPDHETWHLWLAITAAGIAACVLIAIFHGS